MKDLIRYSLMLLALAATALSCTKEPAPGGAEPLTPTTVHYRATVAEAPETRATADISKRYLFEDGDRLYVTAGSDLYGVLELVEGAGETTATFEGDLTCLNEFVPDGATSLSATLVSTRDAIHTVTDGRVTGTAYPANEYAADFAEAVSRYGNFTATARYDDYAFTLYQQSTFLIFSFKFSAAEVPASTPVTVEMFNDNDATPVRSLNAIATAGGNFSRINLVTAFPGGSTTLNGASVSLSWGDGPEDHKDFDDIADATLLINRYYTISRSTLSFEGFRIRATQANTTLTFPSYYSSDLEYSEDGGVTWSSCSVGSVVLANAGDEICLQGSRAQYNAQGPIFLADKLCYIAGNVMSLLADKDNLVADAFNGAFMKATNQNNPYINIDPDDPLVLPATTLAARCYKNMFRGCTGLTTGPDLPAEDLVTECYHGMFRGCSNLHSLKCYINARIGDGETKNDFDRAALKSNLDKWMTSISSTGVFYCHPDMLTYWQNVKDSNSSPWYANEYQFASIPANWSAAVWSRD